jgi:TonB-linked SusC/RagA family outer membrane protein
MRKIIFIICLFCLPTISIAQEAKEITGTVTSGADLESILGATIQILNTNTASVTDMEGRFSIRATPGDVLVVSSLGFKTQNIIVGDKVFFEIIMQEDQETLDEVVVVAYGKSSRSNLTNSVAQLKNENLDDLSYSGVADALKGKLAGVQVTNTSGQVGEAPTINIRGLSSITASSSPLIVVDGFPIEDALEFINPSSIKSIEVLKDASSAALYGSRGANGVILITTKDGDGEPKFSFKAFSGVKSVLRLPNILNTTEFTDFTRMERQLAENANAINENRDPAQIGFSNLELARRIVAQNTSASGNGTDWLEEAKRDDVTIQNYQFDVGGGSRLTKYYFSGQFVQDEGLVKDNEYRALNLQARFNTKLSDDVKLGINFRPSYSRQRRSAQQFSDFARNYNFFAPYHNQWSSDLTGQPVGSPAHARHYRNLDFTYLDENGDQQSFTQSSIWGTNNNNPLTRLENEKRVRYEYRFVADAKLDWKIAKNLKYNGRLGTYIRFRNDEEFRNSIARRDGQSFSEDVNSTRNRIITEHTLAYNYSKGKHDLDALIGGTYEYTFLKTASILGSNFPTDFISTINAATIIDADNTFTLKEEIGLLSGLARVNYGFDNKYLISLAARVDGSSLFGPKNKYGFFPSASAGWNVHNEEFFNENISFLNQFKLRASYGVVGNNNINNYSFTNLLFPTNYSLGSGPGSIVSGLAENGNVLANRAISWEQTNSYDFGIDASILDKRVSFTADYYYAITQDLLLNQNVSYATGHDSFINNVGKIQNQGLEFVVTTDFDFGDLNWVASGNISTNQNRLISLGGEEQFINNGEREDQYISRVGEEAIQFYGYRSIGVWQSQAEIDNPENASSAEDAPGGIRVADINGDGVITTADRTTLGSPFPDFTWGISNTFKYKGFDLYFLWQGSHGAEVYYGDGFYLENRVLQQDFLENRWVHPDIPASLPSGRLGREWTATDYLIQDASYISLREVVFGYTLNDSITKTLGLDSVRVFATAQNLLYFFADDYYGNNPEDLRTSSQYASPLVSGYQRGADPLARQFAAGIDITF